jgi:hypothetical protein
MEIFMCLINITIQKWTKEGGLWTTVAGGNGEGSTNNKLSPQGFMLMQLEIYL